MARTTVRSYSERATLPCPVCDRAVTADLWLILDTAERPDLLARLQDGRLYDLICPSGHAFSAVPPLLVYQPGAAPPLVFSPSPLGTEAQNRQVVAGYCARLADALGDEWHDEWADDVLIIPRHALVGFLSDNPVRAAVEAVLRLPPIQQTIDALYEVLAGEGVVPRTGDEFFEALAARPELAEALKVAVASVLPDADAAAPDTGDTPAARPTGEAAGPAWRKPRVGKGKKRRKR